jgi:hypothetical protein
MKDVMIDIETMGIRHDAVIIQVAGLFFDRKTGELGEHFLSSINMLDCIEYGFTKSLSTQQWWAEQNQDVLKEIMKTKKPLKPTIKKFNKFLHSRGDVNHWSHSTFDFPLLQNYFAKFNLKPMNFRKARDIRTMVDLSGINLDDYNWNNKTHNALDDCKFQIQYCVDAMRVLQR